MNFASNQPQKYLTHPLRNKFTAWWCLQKSKSVQPIHIYMLIFTKREYVDALRMQMSIPLSRSATVPSIGRAEKEQQARLYSYKTLQRVACANSTRTSHSVSAWFVRAIAVLAYLAGNLFCDDWHAPIRQAWKVRLKWWMSSDSKYQH